MEKRIRGYRWGALAMAALTLTCATAAGAARSRSITFPAGTVLPVRLDDNLSSNDSRRGETFSATVRTDESNYYRDLPDGTRIEGRVREARRRDGDRPGILDLDFQSIRLPGGESYPVSGSLIALDIKSVEHDRDGRIVSRSNSSSKRNTYIGYGAGAGVLVGILSGHSTGNTLRDALIGAGLGYLYGQTQGGHSGPSDVRLRPGTQFGVRLDRRLALNDIPYDNYRYDTTTYNDRYNNDRYNDYTYTPPERDRRDRWNRSGDGRSNGNAYGRRGRWMSDRSYDRE